MIMPVHANATVSNNLLEERRSEVLNNVERRMVREIARVLLDEQLIKIEEKKHYPNEHYTAFRATLYCIEPDKFVQLRALVSDLSAAVSLCNLTNDYKIFSEVMKLTHQLYRLVFPLQSGSDR